jgi:copper(I)-binding protein
MVGAGILALLVPALLMADQGLTMEEAWVRALPPTQKTTAAYVRLENSGDSALSVIGASTLIADRVEFHTTTEVDGLMRMQRLQSLSIGAGETLELSPGGTHLMLLGLRRMPRPGEDVRLCLQLATGGEVCTVAPTRKTGPEGSGGHQHHH